MNEWTPLGVVGLVPRGQYKSTELYLMNEYVAYSGISWICRKPCKGITPCIGEHWQPMGTVAEGGMIVDDEVTADSDNAVTSRGIFKAIDIIKNLIPTKIASISENGLLSKEDKVKIDNFDKQLDNKAETFTYENNIFTLLGKDGKEIKSVTIESSGDGGGSISEEQMQEIFDALEDKVTKVDGMGLSHNDFTDEDKKVIDSINVLTEDLIIYISSEKNGQNIFTDPTADGTESNPYLSLTDFEKYSTIPKNLNGHTITFRFKPNENFSGFNTNFGTCLYSSANNYLQEFYNGSVIFEKDQRYQGQVYFGYFYIKGKQLNYAINCVDENKLGTTGVDWGLHFKLLDFRKCNCNIYPESGNIETLILDGGISANQSNVNIGWVWLQCSSVRAERGSILTIYGYTSVTGSSQNLYCSGSIMMLREMRSDLIGGGSANAASTTWASSSGGRIYIGSQTNIGNY